MELYLFRHAEWERLYNCSRINVDSVPLAIRQSHKIEAWTTIVLCAIYYTLYIPCMYSLWKQQRDGNACYRLLLYSGIMDFLIMWNLGFLHGYLSLQGAVYCTHPALTFSTGLLNNFCWATETTANLVLAINRCMEILNPSTNQFFFDGKRIWIWLTGITLYGVYWIFYVVSFDGEEAAFGGAMVRSRVCLESPAVFNSIYFAYIFNPYAGYINDVDNLYHPLTHTLHDWILCAICVPSVYLIFLIGLKWKIRGASSGLGLTKLQLMSFLQVFVISLLHIFGSFMYVVMQIMPVGQALITMSQFTWFHIHALPPVIYLVVNRTIRNDVLILFHRIFNSNRVRRIHGVTVIDPKSMMLTCERNQQRTVGRGGGRWGDDGERKHGPLKHILARLSSEWMVQAICNGMGTGGFGIYVYIFPCRSFIFYSSSLLPS